jgi:predicted alpha/beta hydrolase family esterase
MNTSQQATILIVPGLRDHVEAHWQRHLERKLFCVRKLVCVPALEADKLSCAARVSAIQRTIETIDGPIIVVAHSAGVVMLVHWAQRHARELEGALSGAPPDFEVPFPAAIGLWTRCWRTVGCPGPRHALPFHSIVAVTTNDPLASLDRVTQMASDWGSEQVNVGTLGHINPASGFGEWPLAEQLIQSLES